MKLELPLQPPADIKEQWEGQFSVFSWYSFIVGAPLPIFIVTTLKENGLANAQLNAWGMLIGSGKEPKFIMQILKDSDTYRLIRKNREFVINYPSLKLKTQFMKTITHFAHDTDEITASGLTAEKASVVAAPRVKECFAHLECRLDWIKSVENAEKINSLIQGCIVNASIEKAVLADDIKQSYRQRNGAFLVSEMINPVTKFALPNGLLAALDIDNSQPV